MIFSTLKTSVKTTLPTDAQVTEVETAKRGCEHIATRKRRVEVQNQLTESESAGLANARPVVRYWIPQDV
jgi:hypothetical protein